MSAKGQRHATVEARVRGRSRSNSGHSRTKRASQETSEHPQGSQSSPPGGNIRGLPGRTSITGIVQQTEEQLPECEVQKACERAGPTSLSTRTSGCLKATHADRTGHPFFGKRWPVHIYEHGSVPVNHYVKNTKLLWTQWGYFCKHTIDHRPLIQSTAHATSDPLCMCPFWIQRKAEFVGFFTFLKGGRLCRTRL